MSTTIDSEDAVLAALRDAAPNGVPVIVLWRTLKNVHQHVDALRRKGFTIIGEEVELDHPSNLKKYWSFRLVESRLTTVSGAAADAILNDATTTTKTRRSRRRTVHA